MEREKIQGTVAATLTVVVRRSLEAAWMIAIALEPLVSLDGSHTPGKSYNFMSKFC